MLKNEELSNQVLKVMKSIMEAVDAVMKISSQLEKNDISGPK